MPRRILHFITELETGGAERLLTAVLPRLDRSRFQVSAAYLHGDDLRPDLDRAGIPVTRLPSRRKFDLAVLGHLVRLLRRERIELLHTHLIQADLLGYFAARRAGVPLVVSTKHNTHYFQSHGAWLPWLDRFVNRRVSRIVAVSEAVKGHYIQTQHLAEGRIEVIHNGIDLEPFHQALPLSKPELGLQESDTLVCCVGSLKPKKGHAVLIRAWPEIVRRHPRARLALVGDGPLRAELERMVESSGLTGSIRFLGRRQDVAAVLRTANLFVLPSLWEGFGIAVVEAMAAGVPVVASRVDGVGEIVRDQQDGLLVAPNDPLRLQETVTSLLDDPGRAARLAASARDRAEQFSIRASVDRLQSFYANLWGGTLGQE